MASPITDIDQVKHAARIVSTNTKWDEVLTDWITFAGDAFAKRYRHSLDAVDITETYYDVDSGQLMALKQVPINSIASINTYDTDDSTNPTTLIASTDFRLQDKDAGLVKFMKLSPFVPIGLMSSVGSESTTWAKVVIAYNAGGFPGAVVPAGIQRAAAVLVAHWFDTYGVNQELKSDGIGDITNDYFDFTLWPMTVLQAWSVYDTSADCRVGVI